MSYSITREELKKVLLDGDQQQIKKLITNIHPADILDILHEDEDSIKELMDHLPNDVVANIIEEEDDEDEQYELLKLFSDAKQRKIIDEMSKDEITDLIGELEENEKQDILNKMDQDDKADVEKLLTFEPDTAGGIMTTEYISIRSGNTVEKTLKYLQENTEQDTTYYIIVTVKSDRLIFLNKSTMLFKTFKGNVIELKGELMGNGSESAGIVSGNVVIPITEISSTAQFTATPFQFEQLKNGISKVRLSTTPIEHERTFKKDKIGKKLYQFFIKQRDKNIDF